MSDRQSGFSLVEMLIVLAIMGTMAGATLLSVGALGDRAEPETEARLLANRLSLASDEALATGADLSLHITPAGYSVDAWSAKDDDWRPHPDGLLGANHALPRGIEMRIDAQQERIAIRPDGAGAALSVEFADADGGWRVLHDGLSAYALPVDR